MQIKNKEKFSETLNKFLMLDTPIILYGPLLPSDLFDEVLEKDLYTYIDVREIESISLIDFDKIFEKKIVIFANIDCNKSFVSYIKGLKKTFIATSSIFMNFGIPLKVDYEMTKIENQLINKTIEKIYKDQRMNIDLYHKHRSLTNRLKDIEVLSLETRVLIYNTFKELFKVDVSKDVYLTEEMIFNYKKEKVKQFLYSSYFFSTENIQNLYDILEHIHFRENIILFGDTGTGKTSLVEFLAKQLKKEIMIANISNDTEISDLVGKFVLKDKELIFKEGFLVKAMKKDCWLLLDEVNLAPLEVLDFLESCVSKRSLFFNNQIVNFHPNFLIFCCMNLNDVGKKDYNSSIFIKKEIKNTQEDFLGLNEKYNPSDNRNLSLPITNKREYVRALKLLRSKYELDFVFKLLYNQNIAIKKTEKRPKNISLLTDYIITAENEGIIERVEMAIEAGLPVLLQGDTSTGKTSLITALARKYMKKLFRINNHEQTEASDYFGDEIFTEETNLTKLENNTGVMTQAIKNGDWILLDELNLAPSDVLEVLNRILETSYKEFRLFATQNLNYSGRKPLSKAFLSRFVVVDFSVKSSEELKKILAFKYPNSFNVKIIKIYDELKLQRNFNELITLRDCFRWSKRIKNEKDFYIKGLMVLYERQRGKDRKIIEKYFSDHFSDYFEYFNEKRNELHIESDDFIFNFSFVKLICLILNAWKYKEPVLLIGETGIGKSKAIEIACKILNRPYITVSLSGNTDSSDFIGSFSISKNELIWTDGPLTKAMREGKILILDEINLAENSVLERLNSVLEEERTLFITEKNEFIKAHEDFLVIGSMNPSTDVGKRELSPALRNRFTEIFFELTEEEKNEIGSKMLNVNLNFSNISLRKVELMKDYHKNIFLKYFNNENILENGFLDVEEIKLRDHTVVSDVSFGIKPFLYEVKEKSTFDFHSISVKSNLYSFLQALELKRPILLEGECGTGKTSLIMEVAKILGKKIYKINLCESTEMSDLIGQFTPSENGIIFKEGIISVLRNGDWLLLDEINLCSQSVLEGLNSLLDYRRSFSSTYLSFSMHEESRIFGTMNESNIQNKRNLLPRSFIDRFIKLKFILTESDIKKIIENKNLIYYKNKGLRYNLLANKIKKDYAEKKEITYKMNSDQIILNCGSENLLTLERKDIKKDYTLIHSQLNDLDTFLRCKNTNTPVILIGKGRDNFIKILSDFYEMHCHEEMDISDLIGQFVKVENNFIWKDSPLIQNLKFKNTIYINSANLVEKTVLDRINSLLEGRIEIFEHNNEIIENESFIILGTDEELSPAITDRCVVINPSLEMNEIDISKLFSQKESYNDYNNLTRSFSLMSYENELTKLICFTNLLNNSKFFKNSLEESYDTIYLDKLKFDHLNEVPYYLKHSLPLMTDDQLLNYFSFNKLEEEMINDDLVNFYIKNYFFFEESENDKSNLNFLITENSDEYKAVNFIKRISNCEFIKDEQFPSGIKELKKLIIKKDLKDLKGILLNVNYEITFNFDKKFYELIKLGIDPLILKKKKLANKIKKYFNNNSEKLTNHFINLYKYGNSNFNVNAFINKISDIQEEINQIKERDYNSFIKNIFTYTMTYQNSEFDDLLNYYKISLIKENYLIQNECNKCVYLNNHYKCAEFNYLISPFDLFFEITENKEQCINLVKKLNINDLNREISKYFINLLLNKPTDDKALLIELIKNNNLIRSKIEIKKKNLTNDLLNELLIHKYNKEQREMKHFLILFFYEMNFEECQKYFLDCFVSEFKEKLFFTKEFFNLKNENFIIKIENKKIIKGNEIISESFTDLVLLYNTALLYSVLISKEKNTTHLLSLINNTPLLKYENIKGCLCSHDKVKKYYKKIQEEKFLYKDICFCRKEFKKISISVNEVYFYREPLSIFSKEEKIIGYLMWK